MTVVVTSRNKELGQAAVSKLEQLPGTAGSKLEYHPLDISDAASVAAFAGWLKQQHGKLDILVNNAGELSGLQQACAAAQPHAVLGCLSACRDSNPCFATARPVQPIVEMQWLFLACRQGFAYA
eukprot:GHRQ01029250.1.p2 GENE.GHRQ01029250.1~~GHRQ01029250.1.p2  ORF type:complete len:124 (+),score=37.02 GHRQ01029250.1:246-617(+)